jgi:hypothetical protein
MEKQKELKGTVAGRLHWKERRRPPLQRRRTARRKASGVRVAGEGKWLLTPLQTFGTVQPQLTSDRVKARQNRLKIRPDSTKVIESGCTTRHGTEGRHECITWINDMVYGILRHLRTKMIVGRVDRLAPHLENTRDEQP